MTPRLLRALHSASCDDAFAERYEEWSADVTADIAFYAELAVEADGPLVELAVGNGRVAIPVARATGRRVTGIDSSPAMLADQVLDGYEPIGYTSSYNIGGRMFMKVHNKGQVVIPAHIRRQLGIDIGDVLEVDVVPEDGKIELRRPVQSRSLGGSLKQYARGKPFPTRRQMAEALRRGLMEGA